MRARTALAVSLVGVVAAAGLAPAVAAPKAKPKPKPIAMAWQASAPTPDPSHAGVTSGICNTTLPTARFDQAFTVPYAGTLKVDMTGFLGDWDLAVYQGERVLGDSAQDIGEAPDKPEAMTLKFKRGGAKIAIRSCNFSGGPTADLKLLFTAA